jgi:hypothetical protein
MNIKERINKNKVNYSLFDSDFTKESVYILGLLWADGHIRQQQRLTSINCSETDINEVIPVFSKTGEWRVSKIIEKTFNGKKVKNQKRISTSTWGLFEILSQYDYLDKSFSSPNKILNLIPNELKKYWFRGFLDGDGCVKIGKKYGVEIVFAGNYEQDWTFMVNLCNELKINFSIDKRIVKNGKYSHFRINKKNDVKILGEFIYSEYDNIGFSRKYNKFLEVITYIKGKDSVLWSETETQFLIKNYNKIGGKQCSTILNKNITSIYNKIKLLKLKKEI